MTNSLVHAAALAALMLIGGCGPSSERDSPANGVAAEATIDPLPNAAPPAKTRQSTATTDAARYSSIDPEECRLIEQNRDEGGYARYACPGVSGYRLETSASDLRHDVVVIDPDGRRTELQLSSLVARGAFNDLGKTAEWRGRPKPDALILRLNVAAGPEPGRPDISQLVIVRLTLPVCAVAVIAPRPSQNAKARQVADRLPKTCLSA